MDKKMKKIFLTIITILASAASVSAQTISVETLLKEMVDREEKARFPYPEFTCKQASSYDRSSVERGGPGWFANWDRTMFIGTDKSKGRTEYIMIDAEGPGAVVRFWMTFAGSNCGRGTMRIYIDDMDNPVIESEAFAILSGDVVTGYPMAASVSELSTYETRGHNLYFPIPYARRCRITYQSDNIFEDDPGSKHRGEAVYYNINYRTYDTGTNVVSYSRKEASKNRELAEKVNLQLKTKDRGMKGLKLANISMDSELAPGDSRTFRITGQKAVRRIGMRLESGNKEQALRSVVLQMSFDGESTVWIPAGDFFGTGPRRIYTNTWYTSASEEGQMNAYWVMPFEKECEITLVNYGSETIKIADAAIETAPWKWDSRSMHFGSAWHQYSTISTGRQKSMTGSPDEGIQDLNFVSLEGKGVYIGDGIALFNTTYGWWGEGDEKVFVDGEEFPSHIGTGTEDYYGYAWCRPEKFTDHPFIAQPLGDGSFAPAYSTNTRLRALDGIPFDKSIEFDMELWHWAKGYIDYSCSTFWYAMPGTRSNIVPDTAGARHRVAMSRNDIMPEKAMLTLEGEHMRLVSKNSGWFEYRCSYAEKLSHGMQLYWWGAKQGDTMTAAFESGFEFEGGISALCTRSEWGAVVDIYLNGELLCKDLNLRSNRLDVVQVELGYGRVAKGENVFTFKLAGDKTTDVGIDLIIFGD